MRSILQALSGRTRLAHRDSDPAAATLGKLAHGSDRESGREIAKPGPKPSRVGGVRERDFIVIGSALDIPLCSAPPPPPPLRKSRTLYGAGEQVATQPGWPR